MHFPGMCDGPPRRKFACGSDGFQALDQTGLSSKLTLFNKGATYRVIFFETQAPYTLNFQTASEHLPELKRMGKRWSLIETEH